MVFLSKKSSDRAKDVYKRQNLNRAYRSEGGMMAAEIIEIKSVSLSPNPVQTGGKVKISVGLEANESDVNCFYCIFSSELETSQVTTTATV